MEYIENSVHTNNQGSKFIILKIYKTSNRGYRVKIKFLDDYGYETDIQYSALKKGSVVNPYGITYGRGCKGLVGDLNVTEKECEVWRKIVSKKNRSKYPDEWNCLEFFVRYLRKIDCYNEWCNKEDLTLSTVKNGKMIVGFKIKRKKERKRIQVKSLFNNEIEIFDTIKEAAEELGWYRTTIKKYCDQSKIVDGYQYSWI